MPAPRPPPRASSTIIAHTRPGGASSRAHWNTVPRPTLVSSATPRTVTPLARARRTARQSSIVYLL